MRNHLKMLLFLIGTMLWSTSAFSAPPSGMESLMPARCGGSSGIDGKITHYDKETLSDRINGEAELYFPYGFDLLGYARYVDTAHPADSFDADIYRMGSLLDAFGMFANYRSREDSVAAVGADGTVSPSQLFFYQGRYFVRLQSTGATPSGKDALLACAGEIARKLPSGTDRPAELKTFAMPEVDQKTTRYIASSLLGYDFFRRGIMAEAVVKGKAVNLFFIPEDSREAARNSLEQYRSYLKKAGKDATLKEVQGRLLLEAVDPLYGTVIVKMAGKNIVGAVKITDPAAARTLIENALERTAP